MRKTPLILIALLLTVFSSNAQLQKKILGTWAGKLDIGLHVVFHFNEPLPGRIVATADSPDQSAYGLVCDTVIFNDNVVRIEMRGKNAVYSGRLINDTVIDGTFTQNGSLSLRLTKGEFKAFAPPKRSQTPQPPFPYKSEDVEYDNADKSLHYGATITIPEGKGPFPAAVLITGSGAQDRDEDLSGHKLFAVIADALTRNGIVVLRVDDRGVGKSTGIFSDATTADFTKDVNTSVNYLLSRPEVNKKKLGLIGHSEGGMIAPMVATTRNDIDFIILLAAPGIKIDSLMGEQNAAIQASVSNSKSYIDLYVPLYKKMMIAIVTAPDTTVAKQRTFDLISKWTSDKDSALLKAINFDSEEKIQKISSLLVESSSGKWFKYFMMFDPQVYLSQLKCKVLAINGDKDIQVIATSNLSGIEASLKKSQSKKYTIQKLQGLNHLFQTCKTCTLQEYGELDETISPTALRIINDWLKKYVK